MSKEDFIKTLLDSKEIKSVIDRFDRNVSDYKMSINANIIAQQFCDMVYDLVNKQTDKFILFGDIQIFTREFVIMTKNYFQFCKRLLGEKYIFHHHYIDSSSAFGSDSSFFIGEYQYQRKEKFFDKLLNKKSIDKFFNNNVDYVFSQAIDNIISKMFEKHNLIKQKKIVIDNFKFYFSAAQFYSKKKSMGMLSPPIDFVWHTISSDTIAYKEFCDYNNVFVYHNPGEPTEEGFNEDYSNYLYFLKVLFDNSKLIDNFEDINIFSIWPIPNSLVIDKIGHEIIGVNSGFLMFDTHSSLKHSFEDRRNIMKEILK